MYQKPDVKTVSALKAELVSAIKKNNYNLLSEEVLLLSIELDHMLLPIFKEQLQRYHSLSLM